MWADQVSTNKMVLLGPQHFLYLRGLSHHSWGPLVWILKGRSCRKGLKIHAPVVYVHAAISDAHLEGPGLIFYQNKISSLFTLPNSVWEDREEAYSRGFENEWSKGKSCPEWCPNLPPNTCLKVTQSVFKVGREGLSKRSDTQHNSRTNKKPLCLFASLPCAIFSRFFSLVYREEISYVWHSWTEKQQKYAHDSHLPLSRKKKKITSHLHFH